MVSMSKRTFWSIFLPAQRQAFTTKNIAFNFKQIRVWPYNPYIILNVIIKKSLLVKDNIPKTLLISLTVRRVYRTYKFKPRKSLISKIFYINKRLATKQSINQYMIKGLIKIFKLKKKKRKKNKRLNLLGQDKSRP